MDATYPIIFFLGGGGGGLRWLSGRAPVSGARGSGFKTYLRCVVSLSKSFYSPKVLVIPRKQWLPPSRHD